MQNLVECVPLKKLNLVEPFQVKKKTFKCFIIKKNMLVFQVFCGF